MAEEKAEKASKQENKEINALPTCGIVMPISRIDGLEPEHWLEVLGILKDVAKTAGFESDLVSASEFAGVIQSRIVQNLYSNEIVIVDVSGKNPNVMFELGLRLAFDKATIVIIDDQTDISFDTGPIEHLIYPRDLRHGKIIAFKDQLLKKLKATYAKSKEPDYSTFLKHFGTFDVKGLKEKEGGVDAYMLTILQDLSKEIASLKMVTNSSGAALIDKKNRSRMETNSLRNYVAEAIDELKIDPTINLEDIGSLSNRVFHYIVKNYGITYPLTVIQSLIIEYLAIKPI